MPNNILIRPLVTEKSMKDAAKSRYTFAVSKDSKKSQIMKMVADLFNVKPVTISTITIPGKSKKAIVTLAAGQKIDVFDVTEGGKNA